MNLRFSIKQSWGYENTLFFKPYNQNGRCFIAKQIRLPEEQLFWLKQEKSGSIITTIPNFQLHIETDFESNRPYLNCFFLGLCVLTDLAAIPTNHIYPFLLCFTFTGFVLKRGIYIYPNAWPYFKEENENSDACMFYKPNRMVDYYLYNIDVIQY